MILLSYHLSDQIVNNNHSDREIQKLEHFSMGIIIEGKCLQTMDGNLIQQVEENEEEKEKEDMMGVPVCGGNL